MRLTDLIRGRRGGQEPQKPQEPPPQVESRVTAEAAVADLGRLYREIAGRYAAGTFDWFTRQPDLATRFRAVEDRIDALAAIRGGPSQGEWREALGNYAALWTEILGRRRASQEGETADGE